MVVHVVLYGIHGSNDGKIVIFGGGLPVRWKGIVIGAIETGPPSTGYEYLLELINKRIRVKCTCWSACCDRAIENYF